MAEIIHLSDYRCGQKTYDGCPGPSCDRQCSAHMYEPPPIIAATFWTLALYTFGAAVIFSTIASAAYLGLSRVERAYQIESV